MSQPQPLTAPQAKTLEETRAELIALLQVAPAETIEVIADILMPYDPLREGNAPDATVVGYIGERAMTVGMLRDRARGADEAIARGETLTGEEIRARLQLKFAAE